MQAMTGLLLSAFVALTRLDGSELLVRPESVIAVYPPVVCYRPARAEVLTSAAVRFCVTETPREVLGRLVGR